MNENELNKQLKVDDIAFIRIDNGISLEEFAKKLQSIIKKATKDGVTELHFHWDRDEGDDDTLPSETFTVMGKRLETEEEWHGRLVSAKNRCIRELENAQNIVKRSSHYTTKAQDIDKALEKSTLRCVKCGKPCNYTMCVLGWNNSKCICTECTDILIEKDEKKR